MSAKPNGAVLYHGPSALDGAEIVVIVTGLAQGSANTKTGAMLQTWILRADQSPQEAAHSGADASVCGDCPHRGRVVDGRNVDRTCYVTLVQGPRSVWDAYQRGRYADATTWTARRALGRGRFIRLGAYGDPAAVPFGVWLDLMAEASGWTGYTHQWRKPVARGLAAYCMASVDSEAEHVEAVAAGWRTFRVRTASQALTDRERVCPASAEAGKVTTCEACRACSGTQGRGHSSIAIVAHGAAARKFAA